MVSRPEAGQCALLAVLMVWRTVALQHWQHCCHSSRSVTAGVCTLTSRAPMI
jgi:hypothetical protein